MLVTDRKRCGPQGLRAAVGAAIDAGIDAVQLREKDLPAVELYDLAIEFRAMTAGRCRLIVNDRLDVALAVNADGVHLPEQGLPTAAVRRLTPAGFLAGRSVHSASAARTAGTDDLDYVELGTIFETASKPGLAGAGLDLIRDATTNLRIPCLAIGGIDTANARSVLDAGATGIAVVSAILKASDVGQAVRTLRASLGREQAGEHPHGH
jgi:thiamine-phosphate diphosphorylase